MNNQKKVLIIDDEAYIRRVIELKLGKKGFEIITATNGEEGLHLFKQHDPEIVITDIKMPKLDGVIFCKKTNPLKKERPFLTIIMTCSLPDGLLNWAEKLKETLIFEKPFSLARLLDSIEQYFETQS